MKTESNNLPLEFTGERFTPESLREIWYEHFHRYTLASTLVEGLDVLDAACGEGYGSAVLAASAHSVTAIDISPEAVTHATERYQEIDNLNFEQADCTKLDLGEQKFDAIISFETLEHLEAQEEMLSGFRRLLKPGGWLLISSPDKAEYSDAADYHNPWHVKELYRQELMELLGHQFSTVQLLGQKLAFQSLIWKLQSEGSYQSQIMHNGELRSGQTLQLKPMYFLALCADNEAFLPALPALNLFMDAEASVYQHYEHEIRKNMAAGELIKLRDLKITELESRLSELEANSAPEKARSIFSRWFNNS